MDDKDERIRELERQNKELRTTPPEWSRLNSNANWRSFKDLEYFMTGQLNNLCRERDEIKKERNALRGQIEELKKERDSLQEQNIALNAGVTSLEKMDTSLRAEVSELKKENGEMVRHMAETKGKAEILAEDIGMMLRRVVRKLPDSELKQIAMDFISRKCPGKVLR